MGKQSSSVLKNKSKQVYSIFGDKITDDFEKNKVLVKGIGIFDYSKTDRNIIVGFITKMKKKEMNLVE